MLWVIFRKTSPSSKYLSPAPGPAYVISLSKHNYAHKYTETAGLILGLINVFNNSVDIGVIY